MPPKTWQWDFLGCFQAQPSKFAYITADVAICLAVCLVAASLGFNKENTFDYLCSVNNLTTAEMVGLVVGYPLCVMTAFTFLEVREDIILPPKENALRGVGLSWTRADSYWYIYFSFPSNYVISILALLYFKGFHVVALTDHSNESWLLYGVKVALWVVIYEFCMYTAHRTWHAYPWLYKIAHKEHHVQMDFPVGPYATSIEQMTAVAVTILASKIVGFSAGSFIIMLDLLITQCVLEHAYSSIYIPIWHDCFLFNTADMHQTHHIKSNVNFGYTFNLFDGVFGTAELTEKHGKKPADVVTIGPATECRTRLLRRCNLTQKPRVS